MASRAAVFLIAGRWWLFAIAAVALAIALVPASRLEFDRRIEQMFPASDPSVESYELLRSRFGGNAVAMLVYHDPELFSVEGLSRVSKTAAQAAEVPGVFGVLSLAQVDSALASTRPARILGLGLGGGGEPAILGDDALAAGFRELFVDYTHDQTGTHAAVVAMLDPAHPELHTDAVLALRRIAHQLPEAHRPLALVGEPVLMAEGFELVEADGRRLSTTTVILLGLTTLLMFRSIRWVIAELAVIGWAVVLTRAAAVAVGLQLTMVSSMLTAIVTVIAVASVIHIANRFRTRRRRGDTPAAATHAALSTILPPVFWACLTDAAGFGALVVSRVGPVREFGLMMTLGAAMVLLGIVLILPALMLLPPHPAWSPATRVDRLIGRSLARLLLWLDRRRGWVGVVTVTLAIGTGIGLVRLQTETNFIRNFRSTSELARGYAMVESQFGGAGVWDVVLPAPQQLTTEYLASVRALEEELREIEIAGAKKELGKGLNEGNAAPVARLTKVLSMADAEQTAATAPLLALATPTVRVAGMRAAMPAFVDALLTPPGEDQPRYLRIMLRSPERLPAEDKLALISAVTEKVAAHTSTDQWRQLLGPAAAGERASGERASGERAAGEPISDNIDPRGRVTGYYVLLARLIENLLSDQWLCLSIAAAGVYVMMAVAIRSLWLAAICMIPNVLPVLAVLGVLGLLGIRVNMGAAMIAAVSIGLTIDGSIHFVFSCRSALRRGSSPLHAVLYAQSRIGLPVLLATVALALGFSILSTSAFIPTVTFGVLVTAALAAGTAANLTLLPILLIHALPHSSANRWNHEK